MSQIKATELEGDVAIGRHVTTGGNATIQGNTTVKKNLKVEGWLDAPNIKGANKGLFKAETDLKEAYPSPDAGWWALVGDSIPAQVYLVVNGVWAAQFDDDGTPKTGGQVTIDSAIYAADSEAMKDSIREVQQEQRTQAAKVSMLTPVPCTDEDDVKKKAASDEYPVGQIFYIAEE